VSADAQRMIIDSVTDERARRRSSHLPEQLAQRSRIVLACSDAAVTLFLSAIALSGSGNGLAAAIVTMAIISGVTWQAGLYARSYAVYARDEVYYACACVAISALPIALVLNAIGDIPAIPIAVTIFLCALGSSVVRVRLHLARRIGAPLSPRLNSITPRGWADRENPVYRLCKRMFDILVASIVIIVSFPIMLVAAVAILIESGRPVLFRQQRIGENGHPFTIYKFRTMCSDAGSSWARPGDKRITRIGAFLRRSSLDELPQAVNVLRGEMSIVGPRPEMVDFAHSFTGSIPNYAQRHVVAPGITGWAQLYFKRNFNPDDIREVLPYDLFYVEYGSLTMDFALVLKTICEVLFHRAV
jgi:lipopolysaccharide/colanic/teichoic acid biosynthesis glycosyltransferase